MSNNRVLPTIITVDVLKELGLCKDAIPEFLDVFPSGEAPLTRKNLLKASMAKLRITYFTVCLISHFLKIPKGTIGPIWASYWKEMELAKQVYEESASPTWEIYQEAQAKALWQVISNAKKDLVG